MGDTYVEAKLLKDALERIAELEAAKEFDIVHPCAKCGEPQRFKISDRLTTAERELNIEQTRCGKLITEASRLGNIATELERERDEAQQTVKALLYSAEKSGDLMLAVMRERDEALKDSARLDWLQSRNHTWHFSPEFAWPHYLPNGQTSRLLPIRAAIDAAREEPNAD